MKEEIKLDTEKLPSIEELVKMYREAVASNDRQRVEFVSYSAKALAKAHAEIAEACTIVAFTEAT